MKQKFLVYGAILTILTLLTFGLCTSAQFPSSTSLVLNYDLTRVDKTLKPGDSGQLIVVIQNTGGLAAKEVEASILRTPGVTASERWNLGTINPGEMVTLPTKITVDKSVKPGIYLIPLKLEFRSQKYDYNGRLDEDDDDSEWKIIVQVQGDANFRVESVKQEFYADVTGELVLDCGVEREVRAVYASLYPTPMLESATGEVDVSTYSASVGSTTERKASNCASIIGSDRIFLGDLYAGENFVLNYTIKPGAVGICSMSVQFEYDDASGASSFETKSFGLDIKRSNIDVKVLEVNHPLLSPGDTAEISLTLKNVGGAEASDVTVILGLTMDDLAKLPAEFVAQMALEYPFVVVGSSEKYIKNFAGGDEGLVSFSVRINNDAKTKAYEIPLKIKYYDSAGTEHEISKIVGVEVVGKPEVIIRVKESEITKNKNIGKITVEILNKGSSDVQFFNIKIIPTEQYSVISSNEEYVGTLESDDSENVDFDIKILNSKGSDVVPVSLSIEYKDNYNNEYKENLNTDLKIISDGDLGGGTSTIVWLIIIVILLAVFYVIYKKFIKH